MRTYPLSTVAKVRRIRAAWEAGILTEGQMERRCEGIALAHFTICQENRLHLIYRAVTKNRKP
jgi:hypothetical protein